MGRLEYVYPTIVRYLGLVLTVVLIGFSLAGHAVEAAPGFVAASSMILYKSVHSAIKGDDDEGKSK